MAEIKADLNARGVPCPVMLKIKGIRLPITDCHHMNGHGGKKLLDENFWLFVSRAGHDWIRDHANEARDNGWLV